jgi:acetyl-CoA carboxylase carboxyltransferase component
MDWQKEMDELGRPEAFAEELGGAERVKRQHDDGRLTIRQRVARLADAGSAPFRSAEIFWIEGIIDLRETRPLICDFANLAAPLRRPEPTTHPMRP